MKAIFRRSAALLPLALFAAGLLTLPASASTEADEHDTAEELILGIVDSDADWEPVELDASDIPTYMLDLTAPGWWGEDFYGDAAPYEPETAAAGAEAEEYDIPDDALEKFEELFG